MIPRHCLIGRFPSGAVVAAGLVLSALQGAAWAILEEFPQSNESLRARELLQAMAPEEGVIICFAPRLERWVAANCRALLFDAREGLVLIGDEVYRVGDRVRDYPNHRIIAIKSGSVIFEITAESEAQRVELHVVSGY